MELPKFKIGDRINIDGCKSISAVVTALCLRCYGWQVECAWWTEGNLREAWVSIDRVTEASHDRAY